MTKTLGWIGEWALMRDADSIDVMVHRDPEHPTGVQDLLGTERSNGEPSKTFDERIKRCYELAAWAVLVGDAPTGSAVVHGSWHGPQAEQRIRHAWVVLPGATLIWEPIRALVYEVTDFKGYTRCWDERFYSAATLATFVKTHQNFGPWHESRYP
jgi:hypothetical protein